MLFETMLLPALLAPRIEVFTMGPGEHLFERFGHAAICVVEAENESRSKCYNYGTTDFGSPPAELGWAFVRGDARFWVSVWPKDRMLRAYKRADRTIWRQRLSLSASESRAVATRLERDAMPENRYYLYHHFDDNCSTRVRDVVGMKAGDRLSKLESVKYPLSYRKAAARLLADEPLALLAADLFVGRRADEHPSVFDAMFLPDVLRATLASKFDAQPEVVYHQKRRRLTVEPTSVSLWHPVVVAMILPVLTLRRTKVALYVLAAAAVLTSFIGLAVWTIAIASRVAELSLNEAALAFLPLDWLLLLLPAEWARRYARLRVGSLLLLSASLAVGILRQPLLLALLFALVPSVTFLWFSAEQQTRARRSVA